MKYLVNQALLNPRCFPVYPVAIILLDINMPKKNAFICLDEIKKFYDQLEIPKNINSSEDFIKRPEILIMSGSTQLFKLLEGKGINHFFKSPLEQSSINKIFALYKR